MGTTGKTARSLLVVGVGAALLTAGLALPGPADLPAPVDARPVRHVECAPTAPSGTTADATIVDTDADPQLEVGPGEGHTVLDGGAGYALDEACTPILSFLQLTDFQLVDEESPARVEFLDTSQQVPGAAPFSAAYRPQEALTTQVVESMVAGLADVVSPLTAAEPEFAVLTGDNADSQQYNETRWFIDLLDGGTQVDPDSGIPTAVPPCTDPDPASDYDGPRADGQYYEPDSSDPGEDGPGYESLRDFPGLLDAANEPFTATGLGIPWYTANGNHDSLIQGNSADAYVGPTGPGASGADATETYNPQFQEIATGCLKPTEAPPNPTGLADSITNVATARAVPGDPARCHLAKDEPDPAHPTSPCDETSWALEHFDTTGEPVGHGLAETADPTGLGRPPVADLNDDLYFAYSPRPGFRFIVLDTIVDSCGSEFCAEGNIDDPQFQWLAGQIAAAEAAGEYVMVFSHHTLLTSRFPSDDPTEAPLHFGSRAGNPGTTETLEELYCKNQPTVLAHVSGHTHQNDIRRIDCGDLPPPTPPDGPTEGELWEIATAAHIDHPQQSRLIELIDNADGTMAIGTTVIDHGGPAEPSTDVAGDGSPDHLAAIARELAYNDPQAEAGAEGEVEDRNVIIPIDKPAPVPLHPFPDVAAWVTDAVSWMVQHGYMTGFPDTTFRPSDDASRGQIARMFFRVNGEPAGSAANGFPDVAAWIDPSVDWLSDPANRFMTGFRDGTFKPSQDMTRAEFVRAVWRIAGSPAAGQPHGFSDVPPWVSDAVSWITDATIHDPAVMTGFGDGTFRPNDTITRAQITRAIFRLIQKHAVVVPAG